MVGGFFCLLDRKFHLFDLSVYHRLERCSIQLDLMLGKNLLISHTMLFPNLLPTLLHALCARKYSFR